jgi:catechol 2,3-dioxygenase-like lactoylglutathione lyase family enzyme
MIRGSCLCGAVRFEYARAVTQIGMCHCSQCRKVSGVASNAVIVVPGDGFAWLAGEELRQLYRKPSGWSTTFCRVCGSPLPQQLPGVTAYWVPAGVLDEDPGLGIAGHIFVGSKAPWDEIAGSAPRFDEGIPAGGVPKEPKAPSFDSATPIFSVLELPGALEYYERVLGFARAWSWGEPAYLAGVCRERVELNLGVRGQIGPREASQAYFRIRGVERYFELVSKAGAEIRETLADRPYGLRDFSVRDPSGNVLDFGEELPVGNDAGR